MLYALAAMKKGVHTQWRAVLCYWTTRMLTSRPAAASGYSRIHPMMNDVHHCLVDSWIGRKHFKLLPSLLICRMNAIKNTLEAADCSGLCPSSACRAFCGLHVRPWSFLQRQQVQVFHHSNIIVWPIGSAIVHLNSGCSACASATRAGMSSCICLPCERKYGATTISLHPCLMHSFMASLILGLAISIWAAIAICESCLLLPNNLSAQDLLYW